MRAVCVICCDIFDERRTFVSCPCGHVFHEDCLSEWMNQSKTCPECRKQVNHKTIIKLFFNVAPTQTLDTNSLENEIGDLKAKLRSKDIDILKIKEEKAELLAHARKYEEQAADNHVHALKLQRDITKLQLKLKSEGKLHNKISELEKDNSNLHNKIQHFQNVQSIIAGTQKDIDDILQSIPEGPGALKQMATYCSLLKREFTNLSDSKQSLRNEVTSLRRDISVLNVTNTKLIDKVRQLEEQTHALERENVRLIKKRRNDNTTSSSSLRAVVDVESPAPARLQMPLTIDDNDSFVTPVRERLIIQPLTKAKINVIPYEKTVTVSKTAIGQSAALRSISNIEYKSNDTDSIIRSGYNGFGGHSNFIASASFKNYKPPHKRK